MKFRFEIKIIYPISLRVNKTVINKTDVFQKRLNLELVTISKKHTNGISGYRRKIYEF